MWNPEESEIATEDKRHLSNMLSVFALAFFSVIVDGLQHKTDDPVMPEVILQIPVGHKVQSTHRDAEDLGAA